MKQKGFAPVLIVLIIAIFGVLGYFGYKYFQSQSKVLNHPSQSPSPTTTSQTVGQFCGGIQGTLCPEGYLCKYDGNYPDAGGTCVKD